MMHGQKNIKLFYQYYVTFESRSLSL